MRLKNCEKAHNDSWDLGRQREFENVSFFETDENVSSEKKYKISFHNFVFYFIYIFWNGILYNNKPLVQSSSHNIKRIRFEHPKNMGQPEQENSWQGILVIWVFQKFS